MATVKLVHTVDRNSDCFTIFLQWLVDERDYNASNIVDVVEKPWKWQKEYNEYLEET